MKKRWSILIFAVGLGMGCWIGSEFSPAIQGVPSALSERQPTLHREVRPKNTAHETKWRTFGESVVQMSDEDQVAMLEKLDPLDRALAIEALLTQAGPGGLRSDLQEIIEKILAEWSTENFDDAWDWAQSCKPEAMRVFAIKNLLNGLAKRDPEKALTLHYQKTAVSPRYESKVPETLMTESAGKGADEVIKLLGQFEFHAPGHTPAGNLRGIWVWPDPKSWTVLN
jgi:hypothetical protein